MDTRTLASVAVIGVFSLMLTATSKPKNDDNTPPIPPPPIPTTTAAPTYAPSDVSITSLLLTFGCSSKPNHRGCQLLRDFDGADTWVDLPVDATVFYGETVGLGGAGDQHKEFFWVTVSGAGGTFSGAARSLTPDNAKEKDDATKLLAATKAGGAIPGSEAAKFMRTAVPPSGNHVFAKTLGKSHNLRGTSVYIRKRGDRVLVVEYSGSSMGYGTKTVTYADAWVSELWRLR